MNEIKVTVKYENPTTNKLDSLLEEYEKQKGTFQEIIRIAQEKLGLIQPDSAIIQPE